MEVDSGVVMIHVRNLHDHRLNFVGHMEVVPGVRIALTGQTQGRAIPITMGIVQLVSNKCFQRILVQL
jgi:hypothetical protein